MIVSKLGNFGGLFKSIAIRESLKSDARQSTGVDKEINANSLMLLSHIVYLRIKRYIDHNDLKAITGAQQYRSYSSPVDHANHY